jgi:hypothetical protein
VTAIRPTWVELILLQLLFLVILLSLRERFSRFLHRCTRHVWDGV